MIGDGGDVFWILTGATGLLLVGGGLAIELVRGADADETRDGSR